MVGAGHPDRKGGRVWLANLSGWDRFLAGGDPPVCAHIRFSDRTGRRLPGFAPRFLQPLHPRISHQFVQFARKNPLTALRRELEFLAPMKNFDFFTPPLHPRLAPNIFALVGAA